MKLACWLALAVLGCSVDPCLEGQRVDDTGFCVAAAPQPDDGEGGAAGNPGDESGGAPSGGADGGAVCEDPSEFEDVCASSADCRCEVNYCAIPPGASEGICTRTGCVEEPSICPAHLDCIDLSIFDSSLPSFCAPPL